MANLKYKDHISEMIYETAQDLYQTGLMDKPKMDHFNQSCLAPVEELSPEQIRSMRQKEQLSQRLFAYYLNVSKNLVSDWERGVRKPTGPALKLLNLIHQKGVDIIA